MQTCEKLMHLGPDFSTDHISVEQDSVTVRGIEETNINIAIVARSSNSGKAELTFPASIHIYLRA